ncbi:hypothetical protein L218DRAFT_880227, partial [Marasmius fiardii PR-910]
KAVKQTGGDDAWRMLSVEEQEQLQKNVYPETVREIGQKTCNELSPEEQGTMDLFLWVGCCMHKEMNAFEGGAAMAEAWWTENGLKPPIKLRNCNHDATT